MGAVVAQSVGGWEVKGSQFGQNLRHVFGSRGRCLQSIPKVPLSKISNPQMLAQGPERAGDSFRGVSLLYQYAPRTRLLLNTGLKCLHNIMVPYT